MSHEPPVRLRLDLVDAPLPRWPIGFVVRPFEAQDTPAVSQTFRSAYRDGLAGPFDADDDWYALRSADPEWDPALVLLACDERSGTLLGACHGWTSGFLKDIGVVVSVRGRGVGEALVLELATRYRARGFSEMDLKVVARNAPALRFYRRLGFREV